MNRVDPLGLAYFKNGDNISRDDSKDKQLKRNGYYYDNIGDSFTQYQRNGNQLMKYIWYQNKLQSSEVVSLASGGSDNAASSSLPVFNNDYTPVTLMTGPSNYEILQKLMAQQGIVKGDKSGADGFDKNKTIAYLNKNAFPRYDRGTCGKCAKKVRLALEAGGINTSLHPLSAKNLDHIY